MNADCKESKFTRKMSKNPKSQTKYPKNLPTYIVAFALNENKKSSVEDLSTNLIEINQLVPTASSQSITLNTPKQNIVSLDIETSNEIKNEYGDAENEISRTVNNICTNLSAANSQPEVLFNAQRRMQKPMFNTEGNRKKSKKYKRVVKVKNIYFKNKHSGNYMTRNLKRYYKKAKNNFDSPRQIQKGLYHDSISKRVSQSPILRKVLAKENLLEEAEKSSLIEINVPENKDGFFICSPLGGNSSFVSDSSQGTLTRQDSLSSRNDDITTTNSVIRINEKSSPYKIDIINVAVAQINNTSNLSRNSYSIIVPEKNEADYKESLTSTETPLSQTLMLTSNYSLEGANKSCTGNISNDSSVDNSVSDETLIPPNKLPAVSCDTLDIARTKSYFPNTNTQSICNLKYNCEYRTPDIISGQNEFQIYDKKDNLLRTQQLYDDIIHMSLYPKTATCSNSLPDYSTNDNVIITKDFHKIQHEMQKITSRGDETHAQNDFHANIFQKPIHVENAVDHQKNLNLPNAAHLKTNLIDPSLTPRKCTEEARDNCPTSFPELFDKLTIVLEIAVKRLEKTLSDKVESELKKSFQDIEKLIHPIPEFDVDRSEYLSTEVHSDHLKNSTTTILISKPMTSTSLQCDIVENEVIDKLMIDFNNEVPRSSFQSSSSNFTQKLKKPKLLKDYFEVLKAPLSSNYKEEVGKGDSVQISVEDAVDHVPPFDCTKTFFSVPITFVRENMFVITSVPAFLFVLFVIYSYVLLILRMW